MTYHPMQLADAFIKAGELEDALEALNAALETDPTDDTARRLRAGVLARLPGSDHRAQALGDLKMLAHPGADDALLESRLVQDGDDMTAAITVIHEALAHDPNDPRLTERLLGLLRETGQYARAATVLATLPHDDWRWRAWAGDIDADRGEAAAAIRHYSAAIDLIAARYPLQTRPASVMQASGFSDAAALSVAGSAAHLILCRAHMHRQTGAWAAAEADYTQAAVMLPDDPAMPFYQGVITALKGDIDTAVDLCRGALAAASPIVAENLRGELASDARLSQLNSRLADY